MRDDADTAAGGRIFISHASEDQEFARRVCEVLEAAGFRCWLAQRDVPPGRHYAEALVNAMDDTRLMVLVFSSNANESPHVLRELDLAASQARSIVPVRIDQVQPSKAFQYFISSSQWLELTDGRLDAGLVRLVSAVRELIPMPEAPTARSRVSVLPPPKPRFAREDELSTLSGEVRSAGRVLLWGVPGVGKSVLAVEYAHRRQDEYGLVALIRADPPDAFVADCAKLARLAAIPGADRANDGDVAPIVARWLSERRDWLLVVDNVEEPDVVATLLTPDLQGHILFTSRNPGLGSLGAVDFEVRSLDPARGSSILGGPGAALDPGGGEAGNAARREIADLVGGLPLALEQASAFIDDAILSPEEYLDLYRSEGPALRAETGFSRSGHPSVATTFGLALARLEQLSPASADLVRACAFYSPDAIPEEIFSGGARELGPNLAPLASSDVARARVVGGACRFSLLQRDVATRTLSCHRLVQEVVLDGMDEAARREWTRRAVAALSSVLPVPQFASWPIWERLLPHARRCIDLISGNGPETREAGNLLGLTAVYLRQRGHYLETEELQRRALALRERALPPGDIDIAWSLNSLGAILVATARDREEGVELIERGAAMADASLPPEDPNRMVFLNSLGNAYLRRGKIGDARRALFRALVLAHSGPPVSECRSLNLLAEIERRQGRLKQARAYLQRARRLQEEAERSDPTVLAWTLRSLAALETRGRRDERARIELLTRALEIEEESLGPDHARVAQTVRMLTQALRAAGDADGATELKAAAMRRRIRLDPTPDENTARPGTASHDAGHGGSPT